MCVFQVEVAEESDVEELQKEGKKKREKMNKKNSTEKKINIKKTYQIQNRVFF